MWCKSVAKRHWSFVQKNQNDISQAICITREEVNFTIIFWLFFLSLLLALAVTKDTNKQSVEEEEIVESWIVSFKLLVTPLFQLPKISINNPLELNRSKTKSSFKCIYPISFLSFKC